MREEVVDPRWVTRKRRIRVRGEEGYYHCIARIVGGERLLGDREKEVFRVMLRKVTAFSGVQVVTFAVMDNHVHLLVRIPGGGATRETVDDAELVRRFEGLYGVGRSAYLPAPSVLTRLLSENGTIGRQWRNRLLARMHDLSAFMKTLKQRFTIWYNHENQRFGTLWAENFTSLLVEPTTLALKTVAAYIDLNPVRAGLVPDPADYRWCGYAEAVSGATPAQRGICLALGNESENWIEVAKAYRVLLFGRGSMPAAGKARIAPEAADAVLRAGGRIPLPELLRRRLRFLSHGGVLGSAAFVGRFSDATGRPSNSPPGMDDTAESSPPPHPSMPLVDEGSPGETLAVLRRLGVRAMG